MHQELKKRKTNCLNRRKFLALTIPAMLAGCKTITPSFVAEPQDQRASDYYKGLYASLPDERFPIPAVNLRDIQSPKYLRQVVPYKGSEAPGTVVVDPAQRFLYLVRENATALRYGVGVGRAGFGWSGDAVVQYKRAWPTWTPPAEMILRQPELEQYRYGMPPSLENPLGARALYLFANGKDTLYRLHGTEEVWSIGRNVSSGCIRLLNQDIIDLYNRVPAGTRVIVKATKQT
ncbi:L,D-transpeptidase [Polycladidibacter stylochi]|uniref:L,D-transpeptidase n=1 Tax=Polycladidibacter stylochi TaxID=1807766 RepID=UPI000836B76F|nr:L,D-transpeptidase [Pseudovibrio stylochi]